MGTHRIPTAVRIAKFGDEKGEVVECKYDLLVGADGVNSRVRSELEKNIPDFKVEQRLVSPFTQ